MILLMSLNGCENDVLYVGKQKIVVIKSSLFRGQSEWYSALKVPENKWFTVADNVVLFSIVFNFYAYFYCQIMYWLHHLE